MYINCYKYIEFHIIYNISIKLKWKRQIYSNRILAYFRWIFKLILLVWNCNVRQFETLAAFLSHWVDVTEVCYSFNCKQCWGMSLKQNSSVLLKCNIIQPNNLCPFFDRMSRVSMLCNCFVYEISHAYKTSPFILFFYAFWY